MGAPTWVANAVKDSTGVSMSISAPTGTTTNDIMILTIQSNTGTNIVGPSTGWTTIFSNFDNSNRNMTILWRRATSGSEGPFTCPAITGANYQVANISTFRGCRTDTFPYLTSNTDSWTSTNTTSLSTGTGMVTDRANCLFLGIFGTPTSGANISAETNATLSSVTEWLEVWSNNGSHGDIVYAGGVIPNAGSVNAMTATAGTSAPYFGFGLALAPVEYPASLGSTMPGFTSSFSAQNDDQATLDATVPHFTSAINGYVIPGGMLAATVPSFASAIDSTVYGVRVEMLINGTWTDVTNDIRYDSAVSITRGRTAEGTTMTTGIATFRLDNRASTVNNRYSLRNASGPYYGQIGRNTQIRIAKQEFGYRFWGEVSAWSPGADDTNTDQWVDIEASGLVRRLDATSKSALPAMQREVEFNSPVAYWPCDDSGGSFASPIAGVQNLQVKGSPTYGDYSALACTNPIPQLNTSVWSSAALQGSSVTDGVTVAFIVASPGGMTANSHLMHMDLPFNNTTYGDIPFTLEVAYSATDEISIYLPPMITGFTGISGTVPIVGSTGVLLYVAVNYNNSTHGGNIEVWYQGEGDLDPVSIGSGTYGGATDTAYSTPIAITFNPWSQDLSGNSAAYIGQVAVWSGYGPSNTLSYGSVGAYAGEAAGTRFSRLCTEEGISATVTNASNSSLMGAQLSNGIMDLLRECETTDQGIMYELRDSFGLGYKVRRGLYNQAATLALDYSAGDLDQQLQPTFDDKNTKNDVTVQRINGSSARYTVSANSLLSTQAPPNGVGTYADSVSVSLYSDEQCYKQAGWRAHLGTVDEERITNIGIEMQNKRFQADFAGLQTNAATVDSGSRITVSNCPAWTSDVDQIVQGYTERFDKFTHEIDYNTAPASPYETAVTAVTPTTTSAKADSLTSTLSAGVNSSATSLSVAVTGVLWTVNASANFDIVVDGEQMTVTAVSGTSSPQTFTVTRSVNSVSKSHSSGAQVRLYKPAIVGL